MSRKTHRVSQVEDNDEAKQEGLDKLSKDDDSDSSDDKDKDED